MLDLVVCQCYCPTFVVHLQLMCLWRPWEVIPVISPKVRDFSLWSLLDLHCVVNVCSDVSEEHTPSVFSVTFWITGC